MLEVGRVKEGMREHQLTNNVLCELASWNLLSLLTLHQSCVLFESQCIVFNIQVVV